MSNFVDVRNTETGATTRLPDEEGVLTWYAARGWERYEPEPEKPFVPTVPETSSESEWVTLHHGGIGTSHEFPNNPDAIAGAADAGWLPPKPEPKPRKQQAKSAEPSEKKDVSGNG